MKSLMGSLWWGKWPPYRVLKHPNGLRPDASCCLYCRPSSPPVGSSGPRFMLLWMGSVLFGHASFLKGNTRHCVESLGPSYGKKSPLPICGPQTPPLQPGTSSHGATSDNDERLLVGKGQNAGRSPPSPQTALRGGFSFCSDVESVPSKETF